jgi:hypothetical protein
MNKDEAQKVRKGDFLNLFDQSPTPGREKQLQHAIFTGRKIIKRVLVENTGHAHFDVGLKLPEGAEPIKSRDTGEILDGSNTYWLHPSRFEIRPFTWDDLATAIASLPEEERKKSACISIEDEGAFRSIESLETIGADVWAHKTEDEDAGDLETLKEAYGPDFNQEDYYLATPKGTPFLWDGF